MSKADHRAVAHALPEGALLVEFIRFDLFDFHAVPARGERHWQPARHLAFVLPSRQPEQVQMIDLGEADLIDQMIAAFRDTVASAPSGRPAPKGDLGTTLRAPLERATTDATFKQANGP